MKAVILYSDRDIRVGTAPDPRIRPDEALIETGYAGICGTDLHIYRGEFHERVRFPDDEQGPPAPRTAGHP